MTAFRSLIVQPITKLLGSFRLFLQSNNPVYTRLTREGWQFCFMIAFILLGAALRNANLLVILAGTLIGMMWVQWRVCSRTLSNLLVHRRFPRTIQARRPFEIELNLNNPKSWLGAWLVLVQDRLVYAPLQKSIHSASQSIQLLFLSVPPKSSRSQAYQCLAQRRGRYQWLGLEMTTRFPLGLMKAFLPQKSTLYLIVHPAIGKLSPNWNELFRKRDSGNRQRQVRAMSDEGDFFGLRAYRSGDSKRWIHWRSSARRDELVVKQFQQPENQELVILLDLVGSVTNGDLPIEDTAVEFVATLVHQITSSNIGSVTVAISDATPTVASRVSAKSQAYFLQERLATAHGRPSSALGETLALLEREHRTVDHLLVISTRAMPENFGDAEKASASTLGTTHAFWRSIRWIDVHAVETNRYFTPAP
jgi:uncharacterized protein (DUF58 family)